MPGPDGSGGFSDVSSPSTERCYALKWGAGEGVWATDDGTGLDAGADVTWFSWPEQQRSMVRLADHAFTWVVPGHGRRFHAPSPIAMRAELLRLAAAM